MEGIRNIASVTEQDIEIDRNDSCQSVGQNLTTTCCVAYLHLFQWLSSLLVFLNKKKVIDHCQNSTLSRLKSPLGSS